MGGLFGSGRKSTPSRTHSVVQYRPELQRRRQVLIESSSKFGSSCRLLRRGVVFLERESVAPLPPGAAIILINKIMLLVIIISHVNVKISMNSATNNDIIIIIGAAPSMAAAPEVDEEVPEEEVPEVAVGFLQRHNII